MLDTFRRYIDAPTGPEGLAGFVDAWLGKIGRDVRGALLSTAWVEPPQNGKAFLVGRLSFLEAETRPRAERIYPSLRLDEKWIERRGIVAWLRAALGDDRSAAIPELFEAPSVEHIYSVGADQAHTAWAETQVRLTCRAGRVDPQWIPAVAPGVEPFPTWAEAATAWVFGRPVKYGHDVRHTGQLVVVMPDTRARAVSVSATPRETVEVTVEAKVSEGIEVQYAYGRSSTTLLRGIATLTAESTAEIPVCANATQLDVFCVHSKDGFISHRAFSWEELQAANIEVQSDVSELVGELANGERETVEFKPFVYDSEKRWEIVRTVVAFSNTYGGRIYVGVRNDGRPEGREALRGLRTNDDPSGMTKMLAKLQQLVCDNVKPVPLARFSQHEINGEPVAIIEVPPGDVVHATLDNEVLIRKGSTNKRPDPATELSALLSRSRAARPDDIW